MKKAGKAKSRPVKKAVRKTNKRVSKLVQGSVGQGRFVADMEKVAMSIAVPLENEPIRYSSEYSSQETAIAAPWERRDCPWSTNAAFTPEAPYPPTAQMFAAVFRDPIRNCVIYDPNEAGAEFKYDLYGASALSTTLVPVAPNKAFDIIALPNAISNHHTYMQLEYGVSTSVYAPHGPRMYPGGDPHSSGKFFWFDGNGPNPSTLVVTHPAIAGTVASASLCLDRWEDGEIISDFYATTNAVAASTSTALGIDSPGYYAARFWMIDTAGPSNQTISQVNYTSAGPGLASSVFSHLPLPDFELNLASIRASRVPSTSLMYTNVAPQLTISGKCAMVQAQEGESWTQFVDGPNSAYNNVAKYQDATSLPALNGIYGFLKPTKPEDFDLQSNFIVKNGELFSCQYPLKSDSAFLALALEVNSPDGRDGYFTRASGIEYGTLDVWRDTEVASIDERAYSQALIFLKGIPQFHENPLHWKDIWSAIKNTATKVGKFGLKYGPQILEGAAMLAAL